MTPRALVVAVALAASPASAVDFGVGVGVLEIILVPPAHGGFYVYAGGSVAVPFANQFAFIGSVSYEFSPDQLHSGFVVVATLDWAVTKRVGLDLNVAFIQDMPGVNFTKSELYLGAGPGVSIFIDKWTLSPFVNFFGGLITPGASIVPGLNVSRTF